jgi:hypothetical protein
MRTKELKHEGVTQKRLNRLWRHLLKLEKLTGKPLRKTPRQNGDMSNCPVRAFAPEKNKGGLLYMGTNRRGDIGYHTEKLDPIAKEECAKTYSIYTWRDSDWWEGLRPEEQGETITWVIKKIAERGKK